MSELEIRRDRRFELVARDEWDPAFFAEFTGFRGDLYAGRVPDQPDAANADVLPENLISLFGPEAPFGKRHAWRAWLVRSPSGEIWGRALASFPKDGSSEFVACGYFECVNSAPAARALFDAAAGFGLELSPGRALELRGPVQGSFFNSYRIRLPGGDPEAFYGEPRYPAYYHALFLASGFSECGRWQTARIRRPGTEAAFARIWEKTRARWKSSGLKIRGLRLGDWDRELRTVHGLLERSYDGMSCFAPMPFDEFRELYDSFRYLVHPELVFFVEQNRKPVGFMIALFDPLPILRAHERSPWRDSRAGKILTLLRLKRNRKRLLVLYTGKVPSAPARWLVAGLGYQLAERVRRWNVDEALVCYLARGSGTHLSLPADREICAEYALYARPL